MSKDNFDVKEEVVYTAPPVADCPAAEASMAIDSGDFIVTPDNIEDLLARGAIELVHPERYVYDVDSITDIGGVKAFIKEMGVVCMVPPGQTLESMGHNPALWVLEDDDASPTDI